jgi:hypothetical protein
MITNMYVQIHIYMHIPQLGIILIAHTYIYIYMYRYIYIFLYIYIYTYIYKYIFLPPLGIVEIIMTDRCFHHRYYVRIQTQDDSMFPLCEKIYT